MIKEQIVLNKSLMERLFNCILTIERNKFPYEKFINLFEIATNIQLPKNQLMEIIEFIKHYNLHNMNKEVVYKLSKDKRGRKRKNTKVNWNKISKDDMVTILEIWQKYGEIVKDIPEEDLNKIKNIKSSKAEIAKSFNMSRSTLFNLLSQKTSKNSDKEIEYENEIKEVFYKHKRNFGRARISAVLEKEYGIKISSRTIGRRMKQIGLKCRVRQKQKEREIKNTSAQCDNIVKRDYNDKENRNIVATDVTYLKVPYDLKYVLNHLFLSVAIDHKTKRVLNYNVSTRNDTELVISHIKELEFDSPWIIHSDHGYQYTSKEYIELINSKNGTISMSRVGNSLDNREAEYFFSILKSECLNFVNYNTTSYDELLVIIKDFIEYYNSERIQSNLGWLTPNQFYALNS
ncbi:IS3 family transposase [Mycoplasma seminis]|uniref:IS3 family transposase n=1 Tax=Mycoplasma seminis TaxID=512749 RepID=A0ABY9HBN0_9MOLU|nr:IS3 family transposase [Mycoplasma seminis]WLP85666.1 IS3 family transposase [Mycoplasma seminis]